MSIIDGGSFKCSNHDTIFETTDPAVWEQHLNDGEHLESGSTNCAICGNPTTFVDKPIGKKAVCDKCKEDLK